MAESPDRGGPPTESARTSRSGKTTGEGRRARQGRATRPGRTARPGRTTRRAAGPTARAIRNHLLVTVGITLAMIAIVFALDAYLVRAQADRYSEAAIERASGLEDLLGTLDLGGDDVPTADLDAAFDPLLSLGVIDRVKIWRIDGDTADLVYADDPRHVGESEHVDRALAARLDAGEIVVQEVPDDAAHRFDRDVPMREVFVAVTDASGGRIWAELYVATYERDSLVDALRVQIPLVVVGLLLLSGLLIPLSVRTVRRLDVLARERHDALAYGLAASERSRQEIARQLHDGVIQDLAAAGLALGSVAERERDPEQAAVLRQVADLLRQDTDELRQVAQESAPPRDRSLAEYLHRLPLRATANAEIDVREGDDPLPDAVHSVLWQAAGELVTNALKHASASRIDVVVAVADDAARLAVSDDGVGYSAADTQPGHIGLLLVEGSVRAAGGTFEITGSATGTTARVVVPLEP